MTYMPADIPRNQQQQLDQRFQSQRTVSGPHGLEANRAFHEYKLAALTGILTNIEPSELTGTRPKSVAIISNAIARAMRDEDERAESGDA